jgi:hypothetical protein
MGQVNGGPINLASARLRRASLRFATLSGADLEAADLFGADLTDARLEGANLSYADLSQAIFARTDFAGAKLTGANLSGANLLEARNLTQTQLAEGVGDASTMLPPHLELPESWTASADDPGQHLGNGEPRALPQRHLARQGWHDVLACRQHPRDRGSENQIAAAALWRTVRAFRTSLQQHAHSPLHTPRRSVLAALDASVSAGSAPSLGVAQPWRTSHADRSWPMTLQRAANSGTSPPGGSVQVTARVRMRWMRAPRARVPQGQMVPSPFLQVSSAFRAATPSRRITTTVSGLGKPASSVPASRTFTLK